MPPDHVNVLGVPVSVLSESDVFAYAESAIAERTPRHVVTVNAEYVMLAQRDPDFRDAIRGADLWTPDSAGILLAMRRRGVHLARRVGGSDLIWSMSAWAADRGHRVFLLGAGPGIAETVASRLQARYPGLLVAGTFAGGPAETWDYEQVEIIKKARPDILFVAFGSPAQDRWIARMKETLQVPVAIGVGGSFDYVAGRVDRAPPWMQQSGLEWAYRLIRQPWRWRRMAVLPKFAILTMVRTD